MSRRMQQMRDDMVERVARAIAQKIHDLGGYDNITTQELMCEVAHAAIELMRKESLPKYEGRRMRQKYANARDLRDPYALPKELRRIADRCTADIEIKDILQHAADELEALQQKDAADAG